MKVVLQVAHIVYILLQGTGINMSECFSFY